MTFSNETVDRYFVSMIDGMKICVNGQWHTVPINEESLELKQAIDNGDRFVVTLSSDLNIVDLRVFNE